MIGVFDSGIGGLSVLREIRRQLPSEDLLYVADSAFAPYGNRPEAYVIERAFAVVRCLVARHVDVCVVACNTATAVAVDALRATLSLPIVGIEPGVKPAVRLTRTGVIGVLATTRTLSAPKFQNLVADYAGSARVLLQPCPGLAEQVEQGDIDGPDTRALVERYVDPLMKQNADVLVLGCTHYAFLKPVIEEAAGAMRVTILDPSPAVANQVERRLRETVRGLAPSGAGRELFLTTGEPQAVAPLIATLWGVGVEVGRV